MTRPRLLLAITLLGSIAASAGGQSLGEAAQRRQQERAARPPAKASPSFTNEDLEEIHKNAPPQSAGEAGAASYAAPERERSSTEDESEERGRSSADTWHENLEQRRKLVSDLKDSATRIQDRLNDLQLDARPNPPDQFDPDRLQKREAEQARLRAQLESVQGELAAAEAALADFYEQARRAGVRLDR